VNYALLLFPDFSLILCGYLICRFTALNRSIWEPVERLVYYLPVPGAAVPLYREKPAGPGRGVEPDRGRADPGQSRASRWPMRCRICPGIGPHIDRRDHAGSAQVAFRFNSFIGLALAERLAGAQGLQLIAVLIGVCVPLFNVGAVWPMARHAQRGLPASWCAIR
jgi:malonate transporter